MHIDLQCPVLLRLLHTLGHSINIENCLKSNNEKLMCFHTRVLRKDSLRFIQVYFCTHTTSCNRVETCRKIYLQRPACNTHQVHTVFFITEETKSVGVFCLFVGLFLRIRLKALKNAFTRFVLTKILLLSPQKSIPHRTPKPSSPSCAHALRRNSIRGGK